MRVIKKATSRLRRLRGRSAREVRVRFVQAASKASERLLGYGCGEMSDSRFLLSMKHGHRDHSATETAAYIVKRIEASAASSPYSNPGSFFPSLAQREMIAAVMKQRFECERQRLIEKADQAARGRFDLLGLEGQSFGEPIDWHLEPLSGKRTGLAHWSKINYLSPEVAGDKKITWELNRHQHFVTLGQAYWMTGNEWYPAIFATQAASWMEANPPGFGINWASSLEVAFRAISWLWALHLFAGSLQLSSEFSLRFLKHLVAHGRHLESYLSHYFSPNTHLTGEALGLFYLGFSLRELKQAERWRRLGLRILLEQLPIQVYPDGVYFEQSSYYHRYTTDFYTHLFLLARAGDIRLPLLVEQKLASMLDHLMWSTRPDGSSTLVGDDDAGRLVKLGSRKADDFRDTLAIGAALFGRADWKAVAGETAVEVLWLLGPEALAQYERLESKEPKERACAFDAGGYYIMRDGWSAQSSYAFIDCGPHGSLSCGHAHADALSLEFAAQGKTWIVDPGTFTYTGDCRARDEFRLTGAHNTITVDGESQSIPAGPFAWGYIAKSYLDDFIAGDGFDYFEGSHSGYERLADPVNHKRAVLLVKTEPSKLSAERLPSYITVRDRVVARERHRYAIRYHLAPGCSAVADDNRVIVSEPGGRRLNIILFGSGAARARVEQGWVSRSYASRESALVAVFEVEADGPQEFITFIIPSSKARAFHIEQQVVSSVARGFQIICGEVSDAVLVGNGSEPIRGDMLAASAQLAWGRFANGRLLRACLIGGNRLETCDGIRLNLSTAAKQCSIQRLGDRLAISAKGSSDLNGALREPAAGVVIGRSKFNVYGGWQTASFAYDGSAWKLAHVS